MNLNIKNLLTRRLKWKLVIPAVTAILIMVVVLTLIALGLSSSRIADIDQQKGIALCNLLASNVANSLAFMDADSAKGDLNKLQKDQGFILAVVTNEQKEVFASAARKKEEASAQTPAAEPPLPITPDDMIALTEKKDLAIQDQTIDGIPATLFIQKIIDENKKVIGYLTIGLSREAQIDASGAISLSLISTGTISVVVIALFLFIILGRAIRPLVQTASIMEELSEGAGDLTVRLDITSQDEIGLLATNFNHFVDKLRDILLRVREASDSIGGGIEELSDASMNLSKRTNEQAASITETSTTLDGFTHIVKNNTEHAQAVSKELGSFNQEVDSNKTLMENVTSTMKEIETSSKKIDNIIAVINDISFQTNLLALNAAVEAARAGEAGRGFAVVAAEVRNLAQKTAESSKTIQEIVTRNVQATKKGMGLVEETSAFFQSILNTVHELTTRINVINEGSREQSTGIEQINQAVVQLEDVISQNASLVEQLSSTSKTMNLNAQELNELVNQFQL